MSWPVKTSLLFVIDKTFSDPIAICRAISSYLIINGFVFVTYKFFLYHFPMAMVILRVCRYFV